MEKYVIDLQKVMEREAPKSISPIIILDTNGWKYRLSDSFGYKAVVTTSVVREIERVGIFHPENVENINEKLRPTVIDVPSEISPEDLRFLNFFVIGATMRYEKRNVEDGEDIGLTDIEQIIYGIRLAQSGQMASILTDDQDIIGTVKELRKKSDWQFNPNLLRTVSIQRYLGNTYWRNLGGIRSPYKGPLVKEITSWYKHVAA